MKTGVNEELTWAQLRAGAEALLTQAQVPSPGADSRILAATAAGVESFALAAREVPDPAQRARFAQWVQRRREREPLQLIVGFAAFRHLRLLVAPGVFIPRPETEVLVDEALRLLAASGAENPQVVELCCGCGPIAVSIAAEAPNTRVWASDLDPRAVELTRANAAAAQVPVRAEVADLRDGDLWPHLRGHVDLLVANPPYIPPDAEPIEVEVRKFDPPAALYGLGVDGLLLPEEVLRSAATFLRPGGWVLMEHADTQGSAVRGLAQQIGFQDAATGIDLSGRDRYLRAQWPGPPPAAPQQVH